ncbi:DUF2264 domain-containing protein [Chitinophaga vietnamensis]|uniref:DUF2264 domain-containing protein n=1 Tax=Chitinophaga vietnamensis TaxID=2593957 RepID=UPI0011777E7C|nr:DUF2264 domain-containing protein [Chitinophaga vietnamensis]
MDRRHFLKAVPLAGAATALHTDKGLFHDIAAPAAPKGSDRDYLANLLLRICHPVIDHLSKEQLRWQMPKATSPGYGKPVDKVTYLEAFGRTLAGLAPWLEIGPDNTVEGSQRIQMIDATRLALANAVNPASADYMNFTGKYDAQPLVDGAFLAHGLLRAPTQLWEPASGHTKLQVIDALKSLRSIKAFNNNWLLFAAMIETALLQFGAEWDRQPVDLAINKMMEWYKGDGMYGDGAQFHFDYYNSFVIHPMLTDILKVLAEKGVGSKEQYALQLKRMQRYGEILERQISPEGAFPVVGRSMAYRSGAFQALAQLALERQLPPSLSPGQVRSALTAMAKRIFDTPGTFDANGWLQIGFCGHQPQIGDGYISTGSLYLCTTGFLPLGLHTGDPFWTSPSEDWTAKKVYGGSGVKADHAIDI